MQSVPCFVLFFYFGSKFLELVPFVPSSLACHWFFVWKDRPLHKAFHSYGSMVDQESTSPCSTPTQTWMGWKVHGSSPRVLWFLLLSSLDASTMVVGTSRSHRGWMNPWMESVDGTQRRNHPNAIHRPPTTHRVLVEGKTCAHVRA